MNDPLPTELVQEAPAGTFLVDAYEDWAKAQGVPIHTGPAVNMHKASVANWPRFGTNGAICHVDGHCDFLSVFLLEIDQGQTSADQHHLYEELCYVVSGNGVTEIQSGTSKQTVTWRPGSLFSMPMNSAYRHRNTGTGPARIAAINDMRYLFSLFRNEQFVFGMPLSFPERQAKGAGLVTGSAGPHVDGNAFADLATLDMSPASRSPLPSRLPLSLCDGTLSADLWQLDPGTYAEAKRQFHGVHMIVIAGDGYTLVSEDASLNAVRVELQPGDVFSAPAMKYYQHFNTGTAPFRFLTIELGSVRHPMFRHRHADYGDESVFAAGRDIVPYAKQDAAVRKAWENALKEKGIRPAV